MAHEFVRALAQPLSLGAEDEGAGSVWPSPLAFAHTLWVAVALLALRWTCNRTAVPALRGWLDRRSQATRADRAAFVFEQFYTVCWAAGTEALALYVVAASRNGGCTPWSTDACLTNWPRHSMNAPQRWYMMLMFQGYLHELVGGLVGISARVRADMLVHHLATMTLISTAYLLNLSRFGIMWQALFDISNPFLHTAKMLNAMELPMADAVKWYCFFIFAILFFVARIAAAPFAIVWPAVARSTKFLPAGWAALSMAMLVIVCGIQYHWFYKIVRMARGQTDTHTWKGKEGKEGKAQ